MFKNIIEYILRPLSLSLLCSFLLLVCNKNESVFTDKIITPPVVVIPEIIPDLATVKSWLVDKNATAETASLFYNLKKISKTNIMLTGVHTRGFWRKQILFNLNMVRMQFCSEMRSVYTIS